MRSSGPKPARELAAKLAEHGVRSKPSIERICDGIRTTFPEGEVRRDDYADLIDGMPGRTAMTTSTPPLSRPARRCSSPKIRRASLRRRSTVES